MIIIAESGSTKTDWRFLQEDNSIRQARTAGLNPYYRTGEEIRNIIQDELGNEFTSMSPKIIYFYGAGCNSESTKNSVISSLRAIWKSAEVIIAHDLLAAARSLCLDQPGIACILGTGSNSCFYNGTVIKENVPSLGYVLGDEGSGAFLGKQLLRAYARKELPDVIHDRFEKRFNYSTSDVLEHIYKQPQPNAFLASFSKFIYQSN